MVSVPQSVSSLLYIALTPAKEDPTHPALVLTTYPDKFSDHILYMQKKTKKQGGSKPEEN